MSRKKHTTKRRAKVTAAVTHPEHDLHRHADDGGPVPEPKVKEPVIKTTMSEVMEAVDFAQEVGSTFGRLQGFQQGLAAGKREPRTVGEARVRDQRPAMAAILQEVYLEIQSAVKGHGPMVSPHEGLGVIVEEFDELKDEIYADRGRQLSARKEAIQLAAMGVRYVLDLDPR